MSTLGELFEEEKITKEVLEEAAEESSYWLSCSTFVIENWERDPEGLSLKQKTWASKILDDLVERRILNKNRYGRF